MKNFLKISFCTASLVMAFWAVGVKAETTTTADVAPVPDVPLIMHMADGRYYHPASGQFAESREALLTLLGYSNVPPSTIEPPAVATTTPSVLPAVLVAVNQARIMLAASSTSTKPYAVKSDADYRPVTLAAWNKATDTISIFQISKKGTKFKCVDPNNELCKTLHIVTSAGINSQYRIGDDSNIVVATKYQNVSEIKVKKKKTYLAEDVIYTPYNRSFNTPEVVAAGKEALEKNLELAYAELRQSNLASRALPGKLIADTIDPSMVKAVSSIEHLDHKASLANPDAALETVYVNLALNGDQAYAYSQSGAGAEGLPQFMPATYANLAKQSKYNLIKDFDAAMRDQKNALKAQIIYLDSLLGDLPEKVQNNFAAGVTSSKEMVVAAYNTGPARVKKLANVWPAAINGGSDPDLQAKHDLVWTELLQAKAKLADSTSSTLKATYLVLKSEHTQLEKELKVPLTTKLKQETLDYLKKFRVFYPLIASLDRLPLTLALIN